MNRTRDSFASRWRGPQLVVAPAAALDRSTLPEDCKEFLRAVGLPSNALWFDPSCRAIMCFDSVACLRELSELDVSERVWTAIAPMRPATILGVHGGGFILADGQGRLCMVHTDHHMRVPVDPDWRASLFVNASIDRFAVCLLAYKELYDVIVGQGHDFSRPAIRDAVGTFRAIVGAADEQAMADERSYWSQIVDHLDVW